MLLTTTASTQNTIPHKFCLIKSFKQVFYQLACHKRTHETRGVCLVCPDFAINKNMSLHQNSNDLTVCQSILQPVSQDEYEGKALPRLVGSR